MAAFLRSSAAFFSRAAFSSGEGTFSLILSFRTPAVRLSISSGRVFSAPAGSGVSLDAVGSNPDGT